jgi:exoribonuclease R
MDGTILDTQFTRGIINSRAKLAYEDAQDVIDGGHLEVGVVPDTELRSDIEQDIKLFHKLSRKLRKNRFDNGALTMNNVKLSFVLDHETGVPIGCKPYEIKESNQLIEEFMLLANLSVAERIYREYPDLSLLRRHPPPSHKMLTEIKDKLAPMGVQVDISSSAALHETLNVISDPVLSSLVRTLCVKPMRRALYICSGSQTEATLAHYALAIPLYTHFTSPIRRYADVIVHRLLFSAISSEHGTSIRKLYDPERIKKIAENCNLKKGLSKQAQDASSNIYLCAYLDYLSRTNPERKIIGIAHILGLFDRSMNVYLSGVGAEQIMFYEKLPVSDFEHVAVGENGPQTKITWIASQHSQLLQTFDSIVVQITVDMKCAPFQLNFKAIEPQTYAEDSVMWLHNVKPIPKVVKDWSCNSIENDD